MFLLKADLQKNKIRQMISNVTPQITCCINATIITFFTIRIVNVVYKCSTFVSNSSWHCNNQSKVIDNQTVKICLSILVLLEFFKINIYVSSSKTGQLATQNLSSYAFNFWHEAVYLITWMTINPSNNIFLVPFVISIHKFSIGQSILLIIWYLLSTQCVKFLLL